MKKEKNPVGKPTIMQRLKEFSMKQWILFGITALTALLMLVGMAFPILHIELFSLKKTVLGFSLLGGSCPAALESVAAMLITFAWLHLLAALACIVLTALALVKPSPKRGRFQLISMCLALLFSLLYMIDGIVAISSVDGLYSPTTTAYVLFILVAVLFVGYFVCLKFLPEDFVKRQKPTPRNVDVAEELKKYKELYDMGAITEEEYDRKKKELLN